MKIVAPRWLLPFVLLTLAACWKADPPEKTAESSFVLYHLDPTPKAPRASLEQVALGKAQALTIADEVPASTDRLTATIWRIDSLTGDEAPPDQHALKFFARGVSPEQYARLPAAASGWRLVFAYPVKAAVPSIVTIDRSVLALAAASNALIWDSQVRLLYSPEKFTELRVDAEGASSSAFRQVTVHAYQNGDHVRAVTLGMERFGLPDLAIEQLSWATEHSLVTLIYGIAQLLIEGAKPDTDGYFDFDANAIANPAVRAAVLVDQIGEATLKGRVRLHRARPAKGDADNDQLAIRFDGFDGTDEFARQERALSQIFGWTD